MHKFIIDVQPNTPAAKAEDSIAETSCCIASACTSSSVEQNRPISTQGLVILITSNPASELSKKGLSLTFTNAAIHPLGPLGRMKFALRLRFIKGIPGFEPGSSPSRESTE